jgi:hypothetical protein
MTAEGRIEKPAITAELERIARMTPPSRDSREGA